MCQNAENILYEHWSRHASFLSMALYPRCLGKNIMPAELSIVSQHLLAVQNPYEIAATRHQQQSPSKFVPTLLVTVYWDLMYFHHTSQDQITQLSWNTTFLHFWMIFPTNHQTNNVHHPQGRIPHFSLAAHQFFNRASCSC